jgi:uroporphyrinogen-III decarboxylase
MPSLSPKENYLRALRHEETEYVPFGFGPDVGFCGVVVPPTDQGHESSNFRDAFGVRWVASDSAVGAQIPAPGEFLLKDVTRWKKTITIADVDKYDWKKFAETEFALFHVDPRQQAVGYFSAVGAWERLASLMGFEEAMIAMMEEPEACYDFFTAVTDFKIKLAEKAAAYYQADFFMNFDDIATEKNLFMSPDTYRKLIKPHHKRLNDAVKNYGMIPIQHTCGYAELCVEDYIETGAAAWDAVQPTNNIAKLLDKYGDRFCFEGGFDSNGKPGRPDSTIEEVEAEVGRCFREYGKKKGFIFSGGILASADIKDADAKNAVITETVNRLRFAGK